MRSRSISCPRRSSPNAQGCAPGDAAVLLNDLGGAYMAVDEPLLGVAAFADASRLALPGTPLGVLAAVNFARALAASGGGPIRARLDSASAAAHRLPRSATQAEILLALADLYLDAGGGEAADAAAALAREALGFAADGPDERLRGEALGRLGLARAAAGELDEALAHTRAAVPLPSAQETTAACIAGSGRRPRASREGRRRRRACGLRVGDRHVELDAGSQRRNRAADS